MKRSLSTLLLLALLTSLAGADDQTRNIQSELKKQGFYFGDLDGTAGPEFSASVRRYQIRNGLEVTGQPNEETLGALGLGGSGSSSRPPSASSPSKTPPPLSSTPPRPAPAPSRSSSEPARPRVDLRREEAMVESDRQALRDSTPVRPMPRDRSIVPPPVDPYRGPVSGGNPAYRDLYEGTPFVSAPPPLQEQTLRAAQRMLAREGLYDGAIDGQPGRATEGALLEFQRVRRLPQTGRLDLETLNILRLLPGPGSQNPGVRPFTAPGRENERREYRGIWVR